MADGDLRERLAEATAVGDGRAPGVVTGTVANRPRTVFVFPGQGALRPGQGRALYATAPVYRDTLDEASARVGTVHGRQLTSWCVDAEVDPQAQAATEVAQPLLVAHGVALARQLMAWGVRPDALVGHSVGELAAACVGGALSLADAVGFAAERGRLMGTLTAPGAMLAVRGADEQDVAALVAATPRELAVAAYNGPGRLVISGSPDAVEGAAEKLAGLGAAVRPLRVSHAFHSPLMEPVAQALADAAHALDVTAADLPVMSTLTAEWQPRMDPVHLREHALRPVLFGRAVTRLLDEGYDTFVELGPDENLAGPIRAAAVHHRATDADGTTAGAPRAAKSTDIETGTDIGSGSRVLVVSAPGEADRAGAAKASSPGGARELLAMVGRLWVRGVTLDRTALDAGRRRVPLPPYPYQRRRYWPDTAAHGLLHRVTWQAAPLADDAPAGPVLVTGVDATAVREVAERFAGRGVEATTDPGAVAAQTVILLAGPAKHRTAAEFERLQRRWVTAFREALALFDRAGARRLLVVTRGLPFFTASSA
ncbi:acyltransferase domain-containing protein [Streptomyces sp. NPDC020766]|uniref:acyltransferase domain-containing protein n=1 Tax=Streptomyces sp. NPDC020766 TaxID=3155011 RepID=UPI0033DC4ED1